ncbi:MAG: hypothetical protein PHR68_00735 [Candidatus Gracilibacteria bacterium]|nr:hypothetical protein [Candidatus Gracilibacteria bacterium]
MGGNNSIPTGGNDQLNPIHEEENIDIMSAFIAPKLESDFSTNTKPNCVKYGYNDEAKEHLCGGRQNSFCPERCKDRIFFRVENILK